MSLFMKRVLYKLVVTYRLLHRIGATAAVLCLSACGNDLVSVPDNGSDSRTDGQGNKVTVLISAPQAESRAIDQYTGDRIRSIRIYAYPAGEPDATPVGYLYWGPGSEQEVTEDKDEYVCPLELSQRGQIDFIALLNDAGAKLDDEQENRQTLGENTTLAELNKYRIGRLLKEIDVNHALPMSTIETTDGTGSNNRTFSIRETSATQYIDLTATRAMARLELYFSKYGMGNAEVQITEATLAQGPLSTRLTAKESVESLPIDSYYDTKGTSEITVIEDGMPATVQHTVSPGVLLTPENTTLVATAYMPENPRGATLTHDNGQYEGELNGSTNIYAQSAYKLHVKYKAGISEKEKDIYLPAVERNQTVRVFGLLQAGEMQLYINVAPWKVEEKVDLQEYPTYSDCGLLEDRNEYSTEAEYYDTTDESKKLEKAFACTFTMTEPDGQRFTPRLIGNDKSKEFFELKVYKAKHSEVKQQNDGTFPCTADPQPYTIYVVPTKANDTSENVTIYLTITSATWANPNDPLLINLEHWWNADDDPQDDRIRITLK